MNSSVPSAVERKLYSIEPHRSTAQPKKLVESTTRRWSSEILFEFVVVILLWKVLQRLTSLTNSRWSLRLSVNCTAFATHMCWGCDVPFLLNACRHCLAQIVRRWSLIIYSVHMQADNLHHWKMELDPCTVIETEAPSETVCSYHVYSANRRNCFVADHPRLQTSYLVCISSRRSCLSDALWGFSNFIIQADDWVCYNFIALSYFYYVAKRKLYL